MPGLALHVGMGCTCMHGGQVTAIPSSPRVKYSGQIAVTIGDTFIVAGCPLTLPPPLLYHPCVKLQWLVPAVRVFVGGQPILVQSSTGLGIAADQLPQGPPIAMPSQARVMAQ